MDDPQFEEWVQKAKDTDLVSTAQRLGAVVKRHGKDWVGPCPACGGEDRFVLTPAHRDEHKRFMCRGTGGGDIIKMVQHVLGIPFVQAVQEITGEPPPKGQGRAVPDEVKRERRDERRDMAAKADLEENKERVEKIVAAADVWAMGVAIWGTLAEKYLRARGIDIRDEEASDLRFIRALDYRGFPSVEADKEEHLGAFPCLIAAVRDIEGDLIAVHRTYLDPTEPRKLRPPGDTSRNLAKKIMGKPMGGMIRLGYLSPCVGLGEGIETSASWWRLGIGPEDSAKAAAYSMGNLAGKATGTIQHPTIAKRVIPNGVPDMHRPGVRLPAEVQEVILLGDGDSERVWTLATLLVAARRFKAEGKIVSVCMAPDEEDFNDLHRAQIKDASRELPGIMGFDEFEAMAEAAMRPQFRSRFNAMFLSDLDTPGPEHSYLIDNFLTEGDKSVLGGPSQSGKSFLALHAGMCIATDHPFFGQKVKPGLVVYHAGEGARGVKKRLRAWRKHFGVEFSAQTPFVLLQAPLDLYRPDGDTGPLIDEIQAICTLYKLPLRAVFIDTLATATSGADENSGKDMGMVMANIARIHAATGAHVCLVHHMNAKGEKLRGHTSIYANVDQVILMTRDEATKVRTVKVDKQKDDDTGSPFQFKLLRVVLGEREDGQEITSCVVLNVGEYNEAVKAKDGPGANLRKHEELPFRALLDALHDHGQQAPSDVRAPLGIRVVHHQHWKEAFAKIAAPMETPDPNDPDAEKKRADSLRKRLETAYQSLMKWGIISRSNPWVWWTGKMVRGYPETFDRPHEPPPPPPDHPGDYDISGLTGDPI